MGGTAAYAADLGKNTVGAKQIVNNSITDKDVKDGSLSGEDLDDGTVTGADVKEGSLTGADVAADSLGGAQINEQSLGVVPNAAALGGVAAASFPRSIAHATGTFTSASPLSMSMSVPGYGSINLQCNGGLIYYGQNLNPAGIYSGHMLATSGFPYDPASWTLFNDNATQNSTSADGDNHLSSQQYLVSTDGSKAVMLWAWGWTDNIGCHGSREALQLR